MFETAKIEFNLEGNAFFTTESGIEIQFSEIMRTEEPSVGYMHLSNTGGIAVYHIDGDDFVLYEYFTF